MFLREFTQPIRYLKGIGPKLSTLFEKLGIQSIRDLLLYYPKDYIDRTTINLLSEGPSKEKIHVLCKVLAKDWIGFGRMRTLKVHIEDSSARATLTCFGRNFLESVLVPEKTFLFSGTFRYKFGDLQSSNFTYEPVEDEGSPDYSPILPVYPLAAGLTQNLLRKSIGNALALVRDTLDSELPQNLISRYHLMPKFEALETVHFPKSGASLEKARKSLIYEELFYLEIHVARRMRLKKVHRNMRKKSPFDLEQKLLRRLPFILTDGQKGAVADIKTDLFSDCPMARLLQGDVGCGKTLVAVMAALAVIESGEQAAFMAPTELLAKQHADNIALLVEPLGLSIAFLSGTVRGEARSRLLDALAQGSIQLIVGTHALFSEDVAFKKLGLVIIDEQHKFGVLQRLSIQKKGASPDLLLMTATPIPRTLTLTAFGDLDSSIITTLPPGRKPVITHLAREGNEKKVYDWVRKEITAGHQAYFVYPLIEESEKVDLKNAIDMFETLKSEVFPGTTIGLIHSRVPEEEKRAIMDGFRNGAIAAVVATSVVEVGVDVANATCMVIEHAERFGLSSLHQLRGRVGRGKDQSTCFLVYGKSLTEDGIKRLKVMMETSDGFRIAEEDLAIRGPGEILGLKQSGFLKLTIADLVRDVKPLTIAREDAFKLVNDDPGLIKPDNSRIRDVFLKAPPFKDELLDSG